MKGFYQRVEVEAGPRGLCYTLLDMPNIEPVFDFAFTEMARRNISREEVKMVLETPEQMDMVREGRAVYQAKYDMGDPPKTYILRVFIDVDRKPPYIVTVYRTSKIEKYWR